MDTSHKIDQIFASSPLIKYSAGERLFRPNEKVADIVLIEKGIIRLFSTLKKGKDVTLCLYNAELFERFLLGARYQLITEYYTEAVTDVFLRKIPISQFIELASQDGEINGFLAAHYIKLIKFLYGQLRDSKLGSAYEKLAACMLMLSDVAGECRVNERDITIKLSHQMIADLTGLTRETVTLQLKKFQQAGLIYYKDQKLTLLDLAKLRHILDGESSEFV